MTAVSTSAPRSGFDKDDKRSLFIAALGAVYGDIGTSPLYALKTCFIGIQDVSPANVLGVLSLIAWALFLVVTVKYVMVILRADNRGEGGVLALTTLALRATPWRHRAVLTAGLLGAALFYGDSILTPSISVLSAVEGIGVALPMFEHFVMPVTLVLLVALFYMQRYGTGKMGALFGPIMLIWFAALALLGINQINQAPEVLAALNPYHAMVYVSDNPLRAFLLLGAVVLAVTGGEALYADMGHFGVGPVRRAWLLVVLPALLLNYFGQGALLLTHPEIIDNPFYQMAPDWALWPLVILATMATIIASQAVITGAFSLTHQAVQLGYLPRMRVTHTSEHEYGQVYVPFINYVLLIAVVLTVLAFGSSEKMAGAYGAAVTGAMTVDTFLAYLYFRHTRDWPVLQAVAVFGLFLLVDLAFLGSNMLKIAEGGWFPVAVALAIYTIMMAWILGRLRLNECRAASAQPLHDYIISLHDKPLARVPGCAVYLTAPAETVPSALVHNIAHNKVLHDRNVFLTIKVEDAPRVPDIDKAELSVIEPGFEQLIIHCGFMEEVELPRLLRRLDRDASLPDLMGATYFASRDKIRISPTSRFNTLLRTIFVSEANWAINSADYYGVPAQQVVEMGGQVDI